MPDTIHLVPLDAIDPDALIRDRSAADPEALQELRLSIARSGLRMPIELFELADPVGPRRYGLISGFRRLAAVRELGQTARDPERFATIAAFVRAPQSIAEALTAMVEENAIRAEVSPWEHALVAVTARDRGLFETIDAAIETLHANLNREKRRRLRIIAQLAEELDGTLAAPQTLSLRRLLRIAAATNRGFGALIRHALNECRLKDTDAQWRLLKPILAESENPDIPAPHTAADGRTRPRRTYVSQRHALRIRREQTRDGWSLHFTGKDASGEFIDTVFDYIEQMFSPA